MGYTLNAFAAECHRLLAADPGPAGREKVVKLLEAVLTDEDFVATHLPDDGPDRNVIYEDPQLGFCIVAHNNRGAKGSPPHDHGPSWAIYGQARGETVMTDWECLARPADGRPGQARRVRDYTLKPGMAHLYNEGVLHSPRRDGPTKLIRMEGVNMDRVRRQPYEAVA
jgi:hypothetical protein